MGISSKISCKTDLHVDVVLTAFRALIRYLDKDGAVIGVAATRERRAIEALDLPAGPTALQGQRLEEGIGCGERGHRPEGPLRLAVASD